MDQYRDAQISALKGSVNDAHNLAKALVSYAGFPQDQVIVLTTDQPEERQPTRINILTYLSNLASLVPNDGLLLVSFAGHGIERQGQAYLIPSDARLSHDVSLLEESAVSVTRMHDRIRAIGVGQVIVLLDACRNDPGGRADAPNNMSAAYAKFNFDVRNREVEAFATIYATAIGQRAYEYTEKRQGYFTWALVEGLKGGAANEKGEVTLSALVKYVQDNVPKRIAIDLGSSQKQKPFATINGYRADELIVAVTGVPAVTTDTSANLIKSISNPDVEFWESIKNSSDSDDFLAYKKAFPTGQYLAIAENNLRRLEIAKKTVAPLSTGLSTHPLPSLEEVLQRYVTALGGKESISKLTTISRKGSYEITGQYSVKGTVELDEKRPGKSRLLLKSGNSVSLEVYDGTNGWLHASSTGTKAATPRQLEINRHSAAWADGDLSKVRELYVEVRVKGRGKAAEQEVFIVEATPPDGKIVTLYFSVESGLLLRFDIIYDSVSTQKGLAFPTQLYLEDYVEANGAKIPMTIRQVSSAVTATIKFDYISMRFNVPLDDKLFEKPKK